MRDADSEVISRSLAEPAAFGAIFDRHAADVLRFLVRRVGPDGAEGLLGDVFRIAFERRDRFDAGRESARPWLYGIAMNLAARHLRGEGRRLRATDRLAGGVLAPVDPADAIVDAVEARDRWCSVTGAIAQLPGAERDVLLLHVWEDLPYREIAVVLGIPIGTVRSRLNRARQRLSKALDEGPSTARTGE
jgi:RNA polymerase sigma factor (sigma-70 family)